MAWMFALLMTLLPALALYPSISASAGGTGRGPTLSDLHSASPGAAGTALAMVAPPNLAAIVKSGEMPVQRGDMVYVPGGYFTMGDHRGRHDGKSPFGLYDMVGSVDEWVADWYNGAYCRDGVEKDSQGPQAGERRQRPPREREARCSSLGVLADAGFSLREGCRVLVARKADSV